jgi:malic enzyme
MILVAAKTLASCVTDEEFSAGKIYPDLNNFRTISKKIVEVAKQPVKEKLSELSEDSDFDKMIGDYMYYPGY